MLPQRRPSGCRCVQWIIGSDSTRCPVSLGYTSDHATSRVVSFAAATTGERLGATPCTQEGEPSGEQHAGVIEEKSRTGCWSSF